jgi:L-aminopeptidase/D-esterase-like protein
MDVRDSLCDIPGVRVGHSTDHDALTGCTVIVPPEDTVGGVDVRGGACGLREIQVLAPDQLAPHVHAICLAGGSAYGLAAADGVMDRLERAGIGLAVGRHRVPIVPAAILFDLALGRGDVRPGAAMGRHACDEALLGVRPLVEGNVGAGTGAAVGKLRGIASATKSGLGSASESGPSGVRVGALAAVNAFGDVVDPGSGLLLAGLRAAPEGASLIGTERVLTERSGPLSASFNTTLAVVATDARLEKTGCARLAALAQRGLITTVRPVHTRFDGDVVFAIATGSSPAEVTLETLGVLAARALERAVLRAVLDASAAGGLPSALDLHGERLVRGILMRIELPGRT